MFRSLTAALILVASGAGAQTQPQEKTVVFVCEHGVARSVVAAAHFNRLARERGLPFRAVSRATVPDPAVPAHISGGLQADAAPVDPSFVPARVTSRDTAGAARVVTFDVELPAEVKAGAVTNWTGIPSFNDSYAAARAAIVTRVEALLRELSKM